MRFLLELVSKTAWAATVYDVDIGNQGITTGGTPPTPYPDVGRLVANLYLTIVIVSGIYAFINLGLAGFQYISSSGDKVGLEQARIKITHSLLGLAIVVAAFAIAAVVKPLFGVSLIGPVQFPKP